MPSTLSGYFADNAYPAQLGERMTPGWIAAMATRNGWAAPDLAKSFRMLDIGCGDGLGLALMAASHPHAVFEGMDGMEAHIDRGTVFARDIPNIHLARQLFSEALATGGAPCDFVTAHGVLAWVAPRIRAEAMDLAAARLAPGGICAVSYNAMPGWSNRQVYQHLVYQLAKDLTGTGTERCFDAHSMIRKLAEAKTPALPMHLIELFEDLRDRAPHDYFPHEFLNSGWEPLWSAHVRREMSERGLTYLGQAELERQRPDLSLNSAQRSALADVHEQNTWDTLFDVLVDTPFRIDLYGRDPQSADLAAMDQIWLSAPKDADAKLIAKTPAGSLKFDNLAARGMLDALQGGPMQLQDLGGQLGLGMADVRNAADCLIMGNIATLCAPPSSTHTAEALNWRLSEAACRPEGTPITALAGRNGPIRARAADIGLLDQSVEDIVAASRQHEALKARYFADEADLNDTALLAETRDAQLAVRSNLARRGVPVRDL